MSLTGLAQQLITKHFEPRDTGRRIAVDATCGNGNDTLFLIEAGFREVYAFDIQTQAIERARQKLSGPHFEQVKLINSGHENLSKFISAKLDCVMFNLGYLPGAEKHVTTHSATTISALNQALKKLEDDGLITVICYPGHAQGEEESRALEQWLSELSNGWNVERTNSVNPTPSTPYLTSIKRETERVGEP